MATTMIDALAALARELNDDFTSTTTSAGTETTLIDTALMAKQNDFIPRNGAWVMILSEDEVSP